MKHAGDEISAKGQVWTVLQRKGHGYNCVDSGGVETYVPDSEIELEPQSQLTIAGNQHWSEKLTATTEQPITVESVLAELDEIVSGLDPTSQVVLSDFVKQKRARLEPSETNNE